MPCPYKNNVARMRMPTKIWEPISEEKSWARFARNDDGAMMHETGDMRDGSVGRGEEGVGEVADAVGAGWVGNGRGLRGARIFRGFVVASQFLIQVSEQQKKNGIARIARG